jgi:hypothetical protein
MAPVRNRLPIQALPARILAGVTAFSAFVLALSSSSGCSGNNPTKPLETDAGYTDVPSACGATTLVEDAFSGCGTCSFSPTASPAACSQSRSVNACCDWIEVADAPLARAFGLHEYSASEPSPPDWSCLTPSGGSAPGVSHPSTLTGYVKIFSTNPPGGTAGVKVEVFRVDTTSGALGDSLGSTVTTSTSPSETNDWLQDCAPDPCTFYSYSIAGIPTETPLVIKTSDASGGGVWSPLYIYSVGFADADDCAETPAGAACTTSSAGAWSSHFDVTAIAASDLQTLAGYIDADLQATSGVLVGEIHDCGGIRVSGANADTDQPHEGAVFYFDLPESNPIPDPSRVGLGEGTSSLGMFGAMDLPTRTPIRVSAIGVVDGEDALLGTTVVQAFPGPSLTMLELRGPSTATARQRPKPTGPIVVDRN